MATLKIGSNNNEVNVLVDTGSSDLWVMSHDVDCVSSSSSSSSSSSKKVIFDDRLFQKISPTPTKLKRNMGNIVSKLNTTSDVNQIHQKFCFFNCGGAQSSQGSASNTCTQYGSLDTSKSDTFHRNGSASAFEISYGDGTSAEGVWGYDNVKVGNVTVKNLSFAVVNETEV